MFNIGFLFEKKGAIYISQRKLPNDHFGDCAICALRELEFKQHQMDLFKQTDFSNENISHTCKYANGEIYETMQLCFRVLI